MSQQPTTPIWKPGQELYTVAQTARVLGISKKTIYNSVAPGSKKKSFPIPVKRIGRMIRFSRRDVEAFIDSNPLDY